MEDVRSLMLVLAKGYKENEELRSGVDSVYGSGSATFIGEAIETFYLK
jgi:hypothetical protein